MTTEQPLPCANEAELGLLGSFFLSPTTVGPFLAERRITPEHFHIPAHTYIFEAAYGLWSEEKPIDAITVTGRLREGGKLADAGGPAFVMQLGGYIPTAANAGWYLEAVVAAYKLRRVIAACTRAAAASYQQETAPDKVIESLSQEITLLCTGADDDAEPDIKTLSEEVYKEVIEAYENQKANRDVAPKDCIPTGFTDLDGFLNGGIRTSDTIVISAPTKGGKSILADNIMEHIGEKMGKPVVLFSLEMPSRERVKRLWASNGAVSLTNLIRGWLNQDTAGKLLCAHKRISESKIIMRSRLVNFGQIQGAIRQLKAKHPDLALVVIDYVQLVESDQGKGENREQVVGNISRRFRQMALTLGVPFIIVSQENDDGRARESRRIEMDCTTLLKIRDGKEEGTKTVEVSLNRNGPNGVFTLTHRAEFLKFENYHA